MRTTVDLDEDLMRQAISVTGAQTKTQVLEMGLKALVDQDARRRLIALRGKLTSGQAPRRRRGTT
jgi:Arc/MetJ family transcription regulator